MATPPGSAPPGFRFRKLEKPEEFRQADELQRAHPGSDDPGAIGGRLLRSLQDQGGLVLGAFADIYLAGCAISTIGWDGTQLYHYSHLTLVRPEYRHHGLGFRLKAYQRDEVLRLGLAEIRWTFDPLVSAHAGLFVRRLGSAPDRYLPHYFGRDADGGALGVETDRLRARWALTAPAVEQRMSGPGPSAADDARRHAAAEPLLTTVPGESGLRVPSAVAEPTRDDASIEIPFDIGLLAEHEPAKVRPWRHAVRDAFRGAFDRGLVVDGFAVVSVDHERRSFYFLGRPPPVEGPR